MQSADPEAILLELVRGLVAEVHPAIRPDTVTLDSSFDSDLGFDSLALVELLARVRDTLGVSLPDAVLAESEHPRDLLASLAAAPTAAPAASRRVLIEPQAAAFTPVPDQVDTLTDVLSWHARTHGDRTHMRIIGEGAEYDSDEVLTYADLHRGAAGLAGSLRALGIGPGESVAIMLPTSRAYFEVFAGVLACGAVPVPLYPPAKPSQIEDHLRRHIAILDNAKAVALVTVPAARALARLLRPHLPALRDIVVPEELASSTDRIEAPFHRPSAQDVAFLQYTSGSTGTPKGVALTHRNLIANIKSMGAAAEVDDTDVFVSWLPLYHDMGLIGAWLGSLFFGMTLVVMSPLRFLARPVRWLEAIHRYRGTLSAAPNFAYELSLHRIADADLTGLDLSSWRMAFNGAEPVRAESLEAFVERFEPYGLSPGAISPVYGLAESSVGLAFPPVGRGALIDDVDRGLFLRTGRLEPAAPDDPNPLRVVACGRTLPGHEIRVVDAAGHELPDRQEGHVEFRGPSVTAGYVDNPEETAILFRHEDWADSGDLGYLAGGDIYLTGRTKDLIIKAGRNLHPSELEAAVGALEGVRKGCVATFAATKETTETLVVVAETRLEDEAALDSLRSAINEVAVVILGTPPDDIVLAPPGSVLKTSSGKIRRSACRERYESGDVGAARTAPPWWQIARLAMSAALPEARRRTRSLRTLLYSAWVWLVIVLIAIPVRLTVGILPTVSGRRAFCRGAARFLLAASGIHLDIAGKPVTVEPVLYVANHQSLLDGAALLLALPLDVDFVGAEDWDHPFVSHGFLRKLGLRFVDRTERLRGLDDVRALTDAARRGARLVFFPEGAIARHAGIRPFRLGAFVVAAESDVPVVPVGISGTRSILRSGSNLIHHGAIRVAIGQAILPESDPEASSWQRAVAQQEACRRQVSELSGDPIVQA